MNKYQEALTNLKTYIVDYNDEFVADIYLYESYKEEFDLLQKLVDKETPKKVLHKHKEYFYYDEEQPFPSSKITGVCPVCNHSVEQDKYCERCGQKLDWSDE